VTVRALVTTILELLGMGLIVAGFGLISIPLALIAAGCCLAVIGWAQS